MGIDLKNLGKTPIVKLVDYKFIKYRIIKHETNSGIERYKLECKVRWLGWIKFEKENETFEDALKQLETVRNYSIKSKKIVLVEK